MCVSFTATSGGRQTVLWQDAFTSHAEVNTDTGEEEEEEEEEEKEVFLSDHILIWRSWFLSKFSHCAPLNDAQT